MSPQNSFVAVIEYDPSPIFAGFVGRDPLELVMCLKQLLAPAQELIAASQPTDYQARGELHQVVWHPDDQHERGMLRSILSLLSRLAAELERANNGMLKQGIAGASLHAGLSEGVILRNSGIVHGPAVETARVLAAQARANGILLATSSGVLVKFRSDFEQRISTRSTPEGDRLLDGPALTGLLEG